MFGTIVTDHQALAPQQRERYGAWYCGLCQELDRRFGSAGCASLTYDMTFVAMLLSAVYRLPEEAGERKCVPHPLKKHHTVVTEATGYAADLNLFLAYYQYLDDWNDDHSVTARERSRQLEKYLPQVRGRLPKQCALVEEKLAELGRMERANELNPDLPANCFGELMGGLLAWREDAHTPTLWRMGAALGRFIYLLDAVNDLKADIKKERYNPLVAQLDTDFTPILTLMMAECTAEFEKLPIEQDKHIMENILYAGVWQMYRKRGREEAEA